MRKFVLRNKFWLLVAVYLLVFLLPIFIQGQEVLDVQLLTGAGD